MEWPSGSCSSAQPSALCTTYVAVLAVFLGAAHAWHLDSGNPDNLPSPSGNQYVLTGAHNSLEDMRYAVLRDVRWKHSF